MTQDLLRVDRLYLDSRIDEVFPDLPVGRQ